MHSLEFDKHRLIGGFPDHIKQQCLEAYEESRRRHWQDKTGGRPDVMDGDARTVQQRRRDEQAEEIWDDEASKAQWDYDRQHTDLETED